jgi:hypothetical protein
MSSKSMITLPSCHFSSDADARNPSAGCKTVAKPLALGGNPTRTSLAAEIYFFASIESVAWSVIFAAEIRAVATTHTRHRLSYSQIRVNLFTEFIDRGPYLLTYDFRNSQQSSIT